MTIDLLQIAEALRVAAKLEILPRFRRLGESDVRSKADATDLVTEADIAAEASLMHSFSLLLPGALFAGEETAAANPALLDALVDADLAVVVDPLDGTANFVAGMPLFGVMAAVTRRGESIAGVIYDPIGDDAMVAEKGGGTFLVSHTGERRRIRVASPASLAEMVALVSTDFLPADVRPQILKNLAKVSGFLGRALAARLAQRGDVVIGIDLDAPDPPEVLAAFSGGDIRNPDLMPSLCRRFSVNQIVHGGGVSGRRVNRDNPRDTLDINIGGTINVVEAARICGVRRVVLCSSGSVYGASTRDPVAETDLLVPLNFYGASKVAGEAILDAYRSQWAVDGVSLRIFQAYGPGRTTRCNIKIMVEAGLAGDAAVLDNDATSRWQYLYVNDVVDALVGALDRPNLPERAYNISGGTSLTLGEVAEIARSVLPKLRVDFAAAVAPQEYVLRNVDMHRAARDLGYSPRIDLGEGIARYAASLR
ncbi:inositol monophosphatase family protein [Chelatococcus sp. GCM10030263]|uniref:inositol monophosphatase family protein n=1 Tax=Chelatococcus sp. GCM10030263 TaxID=3273387 RepID=UPI003615761C